MMDSQCTSIGRSVPTAMLLAVALGACSNAKTPAPPPQVPEVSVTTVHRGSVPITTELPGRTSAYLVAQVRARVDGVVVVLLAYRARGDEYLVALGLCGGRREIGFRLLQ